MTAQIPDWTLKIDSTDVTAELQPQLISLSYSDSLEPEADDIEICLSSSEVLFRGEKAPSPGQRLELTLGYQGAPHLACGTFELDEFSAVLPTGHVKLRGLSTAISKSLRTRRSRALELGNLEQTIKTLARNHALIYVGPCAALDIGRITQTHESDLALLKRLSRDYDHICTIVQDTLIFRNRKVLEDAKTVPLTGRQIKGLRCRHLVTHAYTGFQVSWRDLETDTPRSQIVSQPSQNNAKAVNLLTLELEVESEQRALAKAYAALRRANRSILTMNVELVGHVDCVAGNLVSLEGQGIYDGVYLIQSATHRLVRSSGYTTTIQLQSVSDDE